MKSLFRLAAAAVVVFGIGRLLSHAPYWQNVLLTFVAAGVAAGLAREATRPGPHTASDLVPDVVGPIVLAGLMLLAAHAIAPGREPGAQLPAMVWPFVDLWRPPVGGSQR